MNGVIPTEYNGRKYRSRTEARWAVFMDALGVKFEYEKEGYQLGDFFYLPDFWLPEMHCFIEIKGAAPALDECTKAILLAEFTSRPVFIFFGSPEQPWREGEVSKSGHKFTDRGEHDTHQWFCECQDCHKISIEFLGLANRMICPCMFEGRPEKGRDIQCDSPRIRVAYDKSKRYEFWAPGGAK